MRLTPDNTTRIGDGLDHPEGVCLGEDGSVFAGGEAGQVYQIHTDGRQRQIGSTSGFLLGIAIDAAERIHACDCGHRSIMRIDQQGTVVQRSAGAPDRSFTVPNYPVFDESGNLIGITTFLLKEAQALNFAIAAEDYWH